MLLIAETRYAEWNESKENFTEEERHNLIVGKMVKREVDGVTVEYVLHMTLDESGETEVLADLTKRLEENPINLDDCGNDE